MGTNGGLQRGLSGNLLSGKKNGYSFDYIFLASSTNATQSGLLAGSLEESDERNIVGISVSRNETRGKQVIARNLEEYAQMHKKQPASEF